MTAFMVVGDDMVVVVVDGRGGDDSGSVQDVYDGHQATRRWLTVACPRRPPAHLASSSPPRLLTVVPCRSTPICFGQIGSAQPGSNRERAG
jgi:hypothetical protein